ncbi:unnamed protein product [Cunninghamella blakesleeana]
MCYLIGWMTFKGIGLDKDIDKAIQYFKMASELDHDAATYQLATMMEDKYLYPDLYDIEQSVVLYEKMITKKRKKKNNNMNGSNNNNNISNNNNNNNSMIMNSPSINNITENTTFSGPDINALTKLARVYYEGEQESGQKRDIEKAYQYARKVAEMNGEKYCQFIVGDILLKNKKDIQQSIFWLSQSGQQGFPSAIETLSKIYFEGLHHTTSTTSIKSDYEQAHEWCLKGDDIWPSGLGYCQSCLGDMYRKGLGVPKDLMKSFEYYQKAASHQDTPQNYARYMLGEMFYLGEDGGWIQNIPVAKDYYRIAANDQYEPAKQRLKEIELEEKKQFELSMIPNKKPSSNNSNSNKQWKFMSLFGGRKKVSA